MSSILHGTAGAIYPERIDRKPTILEQAWRRLRGWQIEARVRPAHRYTRRAQAIVAYSTALEQLELDELKQRVGRVGRHARLHGLDTSRIDELFALLRECAGRTLGMRHYPRQIEGGLALMDGSIAQMPTGEGKTLTATLAAATAALAGMPVHLLTVNDYLADRDAQSMAPLYECVGLSVGVVTGASSERVRRAAYSCDVAYCTSNQVVFDYLRDSMTLDGVGTGLRLSMDWMRGRRSRRQKLFLRGLGFAIVDEADSVMIDEARTPLIISGPEQSEDLQRATEQALHIASTLIEAEHYVLHTQRRRTQLTEAGQAAAKALAEDYAGFWQVAIYREELVRQALSALHLFHRDEHYLVRDDKVGIIDEHTGRVTPGRTWTQGLHQMIEAKEGCPVTMQRETLAQISYQRFLRRYLHLSGMTGTAEEVSRELWQVYRTPVVPVLPQRPSQRVLLRDRVYATNCEKWQGVIERVAELHLQGRPVLIGARTVAASETLDELLTRAGIAHRVLNARQDAEEAALVAQAGQPGAVTVATNMAGRGTDIVLGEGVAQSGGLHVIVTERHEAARIDRQLLGRAGRQGDPGSGEFMLSLEDPLALRQIGMQRMVLRVARAIAGRGRPTARWRGYPLRAVQRRIQSIHSAMRRELLRNDEQIAKQLAFSGRGE